jgi:hypothetical protein
MSMKESKLDKIIAFIFPLLGIIMYLSKKKYNYDESRELLRIAVAGFIFEFVLFFLF